MDIPEPLDLRSHTIAEDKREALLKLFPEARTEGGKLDFDLLKRALGETVDAGRERYGMQWPGKADCFKAIQAPSMATLRPVPEESVDFENTQNLIIEGDNLQVLKLLQKGYQGKVKMIYIDPPYNTGKDFIYPDNYTEDLRTYLQYTGQVDAEGRKWGSNTDTDGRFHSKWLNMMYPRLYLARNLLREDGVVFISIDDNELSNAIALCDELFGEENCVTIINWKTRGTGGQVKQNALIDQVEYVLVYAKSMTEVRINKLPNENAGDTKWRDYRKSGGDWQRRHRPEQFFPFFYDEKNNVLSMDPIPNAVEVIPADANGEEGFWENGKTTARKRLADGELRCRKVKERWKIEQYEVADVVTNAGNFIDISSLRGGEEMKSLMGRTVFNNPKPTDLLNYLLTLGSDDDSVVLDFFAGSGSTAHAVILKNLSENGGGNRQFILTQLPEPIDHEDKDQAEGFAFCKEHNLEPTISSITKERVRRVIKKLEAEQAGKLQLEAKPDLGFRVYKLAESNFKPWDASVREPEALVQQMQLHVHHVLEGRSEQDLLAEVMLKSGFMLTAPVEEVMLDGVRAYDVNHGELLVCLSDALTHDALKAMAARQPQRAVCLDSGFQGNDQLKANAVQLFKAKGVVFRTV